MSGGGGGGGPTQTTNVTTNVPEYAKPYVMNMLGATQNQLFNTTPGVGGEPGEIIGFKQYQPYSQNVTDYFAPMSALQANAYGAASRLQTPGQFGTASNLAGAAGEQALGYGQAGAGYGAAGQMYGAQGAQQAQLAAQQAQRAAQMYGQQGSIYGAQAAGLAPAAQMYGQGAANIGMQGLGYGAQGAGYGQQAADMARMGFGAGQQYAQQATDPGAVAKYMSPYQQQVTDVAKAAAVREAQMADTAGKLASARSGTYGGARQALASAERERNLLSNLSNIQAQGAQSAYDRAQAAQQFGANLGLQGLQAGYQGLGQGIQGAQTGLSGLGTAMQGQQAGLSGLQQAGSLYGQGMQGAQTGLSGVGQMLGAGNLGLAGTAQGIQGAQAGMQGAGVGLTGLGQATSAAGTLGQLGTQQQAADINAINLQTQIGKQQQDYQQNLINQAIQDYATQQQYPLMQLGFMSNILRGLPMQGTSTQMYQAQPSAVSQLGGLAATGLGAYGAMGGFRAAKGGIVPGYKKGGTVKRYDVGGSVEAQLADMPDAKLAEIAKTSPSQEVRKIATRLLMEHRLEAQAQQQSGLAAAPAPNLDNMDAMADGGIVAFQNRGKVELNDDTYDENVKQLTGKELRRAQIEAAMDSAKNPLAVLNPGELWSGLKGFLANPENQNTAKRWLAAENSPVAQSLPPVPVKAIPAAAPAANPNAPAAAPAAPAAPENDGTGIKAAGKYDARIEKLFADLEAKSPTAGLAQEDLNRLRAESEANKDRKLWQALMMGGAKAMAGKSQYALSNIGEGIAGGVEDYAKSEAAERADKKLLIAQQSALEQAEYARKTGNLNALVAAQARLDNVKLQTMALALQKQGITDSKLQGAITARAKLILGNNAMPSPQEVDDAVTAATAQVTGKSTGPNLSQQAAEILKNRQSKG